MRSYFCRLALIIGFLGCADSPVTHDEVLAAKTATEFAEAAFVQQDIQSAHARLSDAAKRYLSVNDMREALSKLHPRGYPSRVVATEYEPIPAEQKAIYIFLVGQGSGQPLRYRLTMERTASSDYKVAVFDRVYGHSESPLRKSLHP